MDLSTELGIASCIRDFAHAIRGAQPPSSTMIRTNYTNGLWTEREKRTPKVLQTSEVLTNDDLMVWQYCHSLQKPPENQHLVPDLDAQRYPRRHNRDDISYRALTNPDHRAARPAHLNVGVSSVPAQQWATGVASDDEDSDDHEDVLQSQLEEAQRREAQKREHTRTGKARQVEAKARHAWRVADTVRPRFGIKPRARLAGIAALHRVDASKVGHNSRLKRAAQAQAQVEARSAAKAKKM